MTHPTRTHSGATKPYLGRRLAAVTAALAMSVTTCSLAGPASAGTGQGGDTRKAPTATGHGGAVSTVDLDASAAAIKVFRKGGNAVDAAVAAAGTLGVTEPYSAGIGGGQRRLPGGRDVPPADCGQPGPLCSVEATRELFLPGGAPPAVGTVFKNPDLAETYKLLARKGMDAFYEGKLAEDIVRTVRHAPASPGSDTLPGPAGVMTAEDLDDYEALDQEPAHVNYRGYDSGGTTVGEALNILEVFDLPGLKADQPAVLHHYLEASALAFADRGKYVGDPAFVDVPTEKLLDPVFGKERACELDPLQAAQKPVLPGDADSYDGVCPVAPAALAGETDTENISTTNLTASDKWGNVVEYTLTIEQTGGSGIVVPDRGFILNNELTDFSPVYSETDPNRIEPGKRPRSSMSPTIVLKDGKPFLALGSPGGSTIITTVLQTLINRIDLGMGIEEALAAPRASQRNTASVTAEPAFISTYGTELTSRFGHVPSSGGDAFTSLPEIGAATAIEFSEDGRTVTAVAEPTRRGGGSAMVVRPSREPRT